MGKLNGRSGAVGYKRPPAHSRFEKGKSGNPKGRPKGRRTGTTLASLINQTVTVTIDGESRKVPLAEAITLSLFQRGVGGNVAAAREVIKIMEKVEAQQKSIEETLPSNVIFRLVSPELKDCNTALQKLGVIEQYTDSWRICTWVVEAALARDSRLLLDETDRGIVANNMLVPSMLETILPKAA
jgi:Family of unknown function (DUF5681)